MTSDIVLLQTSAVIDMVEIASLAAHACLYACVHTCFLSLAHVPEQENSDAVSTTQMAVPSEAGRRMVANMDIALVPRL